MNFDVSILDEYNNAWNISSSKNNEELRSCEQKLIKLEIEELHKLLNPLKWAELHILCDSDQIYKTCILLHLIRLFSIPGEVEEEKEKIKIVQDHLNKVLHNLSEKMLYSILDRFISQQLKFKSELTEMDLLTNQIDPYYVFWLKLCYWDTFLVKSDKDSCVKFLKQNGSFFIHAINSLNAKEYNKAKFIFCKIVLCFLKWDICTSNIIPRPVLIAFQHLIMNTPLISIIKPHLPDFNMSDLLHLLFLTLSEDNISTAFKDYLNQMYAMKIEITEDDFYSGEIEPYQEFLLKLCYFEKLCDENDDETCKKFIRRNADFLVPLINMVELNKTKTKLISCKVMSCLSKWGIPNQNTAWIHLSNILGRKLDNKVCQSCMNENTFFILSMVDTVMASNDVQVVMIFCDVLLCIPYNQLHFHDVTDAVNKLIRHYAKPFRIGDKICQWIIELGFRFLKHLNDMQKLDTAKQIIVEDFKKYFNLIEDLFTDSCHDRRTLELNINHFRDNKYSNQCFQCDYCMHRSVSSEEQDETRLKELWIDKIKCKVKALKILNKKRNKGQEISVIEFENLITMKIGKLNVAISEGNFIDEWEANIKEDQLDAKNMEDQLNAIYMDEQIMKKLKLHEMLVLLMMLLIVMAGTSTGHHKSAKLKKYLSLKYEYDKIILYLLWCSGDIEVHPGPTLKKKSLAHDSTIERRWIQNVSQKLIIILPSSIQSKYKTTKNRRNDRENREHFKTLLKKCLEERVHVPKMYLAEINAWETMKYHLLYKLFVYRCEFEAVIASIKDFVNFKGSTKDLTDINVSFNTELKTNEIEMILGKDQRPTNQSQLMVYITRHIAGISIKCAYGKDPDAKCDGLWDLPLINWPKDITLFDPNNRGNYHKKLSGKKLISDQELVDILITLPQVTIPQKYTKIVDAYKLMRKSITKKHKADLCSTFKKSTSLEKMNYSLINLCKNGIFTKEVHNILSKWWTTRAVEIGDDQKLSQAIMDDGEKKERPHISINISTAFISITVDPTIESSSHVKYDFPFNDDLIPLKTIDTAVNQNTIQLPSSDVKTPDANPVDTQTDSITIPQEDMNILNSFISVDHIGHVSLKSEIKVQGKTSTQDPASSSMTHLDQSISPTFQFNHSNTQTAVSGQLVSITCASDQSTIYADDQGNSILNTTNASQNQSSSMGFPGSMTFINSKVVLNSEHQFNNVMTVKQLLLTNSDNSSDNGSNTLIKPTIGSKRKTKSIGEDIDEDQLRDGKKSLLSTQMMKKKKPVLRPVHKQTETDKNQIVPFFDNSTMVNSNMNWLLDCQSIGFDSPNSPYLSADEIISWT